ncbi:hypothetical protein ACRAWG_10235 [Methylobacterium sp. P31]
MTGQEGSFRLRVEPCRRELNRYSWTISGRGHVVRQSCYSLPSEQEACSRGQLALKDVEAL